MGRQKVVLITGASSGLGKITASLLADGGYAVFGTSRHPQESNSLGFEMIQLDVCSDESVDACIRKLLDRASRLDVLINNAGYELAGAIEETSLNEAKSQFETNFWGSVRMVKAVLPVMRQQRSGQIINVGSLAGLVGVPFHGFYSASKFALEGYTEALRHEVSDLNMRVSIVEPGFMKTQLDASAYRAASTMSDYDHVREQALRYFSESINTAEDPINTARVIFSMIESNNPLLRYRVGKLAKKIFLLKTILPQKMFEQGTRRNYRLDVKPQAK